MRFAQLGQTYSFCETPVIVYVAACVKCYPPRRHEFDSRELRDRWATEHESLTNATHHVEISTEVTANG